MIDFEDPQEVVEQRLQNARKRRFQFIFFVVLFGVVMGTALVLDYDVVTRRTVNWRGTYSYYVLYTTVALIGIPAYLAARHFATKRYGNDDDVV